MSKESNFYRSLNIVIIVKPTKLQWAALVDVIQCVKIVH